MYQYYKSSDKNVDMQILNFLLIFECKYYNVC